MTTITPQVPCRHCTVPVSGRSGDVCKFCAIYVPPGADHTHIDDWEPAQNGKQAYRHVWSKQFEPDIDVRVVVVQFDDGTIADGEDDPDDHPLVYIGCSDFLPADARAIAASIMQAADLADEWAGVKR